MKSIIATDIDDCKAPFNHHFVRYWNQRFGTRYALRDLTTYDFAKVFNVSTEKTIAVLHDFYETEEFRKIAPHAPAVRLVQELKRRGHTLVSITHRSKAIEPFTHHWLAQYFPGVYPKENVHFTDKYGRAENRRMSKAALGSELGVSIIIDDCREVCVECANAGMHAFMPQRPWNQSCEPLPKNVIPVRTLLEILQHPLLAES